jgi:hypothetical protein
VFQKLGTRLRGDAGRIHQILRYLRRASPGCGQKTLKKKKKKKRKKKKILTMAPPRVHPPSPSDPHAAYDAVSDGFLRGLLLGSEQHTTVPTGGLSRALALPSVSGGK